MTRAGLVFVAFFLTALALGTVLGVRATNAPRGVEFVTLHHLYVLETDRSGLVKNPTIVWRDGFACLGDDELLRSEFVQNEETGLLMLACFWRQQL